MVNENIFKQFCKYVDEQIFPDEKKGEVVAFVVDQTFINDFCKIYITSENELMNSLASFIRSVDYSHKYSLNPIKYDESVIRGIIAIQVFAATKRANSDGITENNYRDRLSDLIFFDTGELQRWMTDCQDHLWKMFYKWCDENDFRVSKKCVPYSGKGRYVQYPLQEAYRVFTIEALLNFARAFVDKGLSPEEDIPFDSFWKIISWRDLSSYIDSLNAKRIYYDRSLYDDARQQIYNYFLRWDGTYRIAKSSESKKCIPQISNVLYLTDDFENFEILDTSTGNLLHKVYPLSTARYMDITKAQNHIPKRRNGVFIFKRNTGYGIWEEVRYLEEEQQGIAIIFLQESNIIYTFRNCPAILTTPRCKIVKLTYCPELAEYFIEKRPFYLEGGLKIGRNQYLLGAAPIFVREKQVSVRIDKNKLQDNSERVNLNYLGNGPHIIYIPGHKSISLELVDLSVLMSNNWNETNHTWAINRSDATWRSSLENTGISGMDMSAICQEKYMKQNETPAAQAWCKIYMGQSQNSNNIVNRTLKAITDNDNI